MQKDTSNLLEVIWVLVSKNQIYLFLLYLFLHFAFIIPHSQRFYFNSTPPLQVVLRLLHSLSFLVCEALLCRVTIGRIEDIFTRSEYIRIYVWVCVQRTEKRSFI